MQYQDFTLNVSVKSSLKEEIFVFSSNEMRKNKKNF